MAEKQCLKCGAELVVPATGRPPSYCGEACRRVSENEVRRVSRHLEKLETERRTLSHDRRDDTVFQWRDPLGRTLKQAREDVEADIAELEARLRNLVGE